MALALQDFAALVRTQAAAVTGSARTLIDTSVGSVLRAVLEANAGVALWLQWLIVEVLATTRAATSRGADLDSWMLDFGLERLPAEPAHGTVTFSRATPGLATEVPVGALARGGDMLFRVVEDGGHPAWTGTGYALPAGAVSVDAPVAAVVPGRAGNVRAGEIKLLASAIAGVDLVTNAAGLTGGLDTEADDALRTRFSVFLDSRSRATLDAVVFAIRGVRQGLDFRIQERVDAAGQPRDGHFTVTIDDGTGFPPAALLADVALAIERVRPIGGTFSVRAPLVVRAAVAMRVSGPDAARAAVRAALGEWIATRPIGDGLVLSKLTQVAHSAHPAVVSVFGLTINGVADDLRVPPFGMVRASGIEVTA